MTQNIAAEESFSAPESYVRELARADAASLDLRVAPPFAAASAARQLVSALVEAGADTFFGVPGGPVSPVFDAILQEPRAQLIESRQETAAAFAAADYQRASGKTPVVVVTAGPGATNVVTGVVSAHLERIPMLVICGDVAWEAVGGKLLQDSGPEGIAVEKLLANVTRATVRAAQPRTVVTQGLAALGAANDPNRPGPALLVLPIHRARASTEAPQVTLAPTSHVARPERSVVLDTARTLANAEHPLIVVGAGCRGHETKIRRLLDALDIPFVTTPQAKGLVSEMHPRSLRHGGLAASMWAREYTALGVDAALVLGTDLDDCSVGPTPYIKTGGTLIHVDLDAAVFGRNLVTSLGIVADVGAFAEEMYDVVVDEQLRHGRIKHGLREIRSKSAFEIPDFARDEAPCITPQRAIADLQAACGSETAYITDIGEHMLFALHYLTATRPDAFSIHLGLGSMGSGICGAIGLALAKPERPVTCICGDGGMQMVGMEAVVALKYRLPIVYAVFNDARYNMVYHGHRQVYGREAPWDAPWIDFAGWARSMGMAGIRVNHPGEITREQLQRLRQTRVPIVLDIRIDRNARVSGGGRNEALQHMSVLESSGES